MASTKTRKLCLPAALAGTVVAVALTVGAAACGGEEEHHYFCFAENVDSGGVDAGTGPVDCPATVERIEDCPPGCEAVG